MSICALPLTRDQIYLLIQAADSRWRDVEPAIFGTLLERALAKPERRALGAHYMPRAYVSNAFCCQQLSSRSATIVATRKRSSATCWPACFNHRLGLY
jgi:hypothetical protein